MRALGLIVGGMLALTASIAGHAAPSFQRAVPSTYGAAAVGVGTRCLAIGADGEADGFPRIARLTTIMADGVLMALGKAPTEFGVLTAIGEAPTRVGIVPAKAHQP